jgi:hypothetical protein
MKAVLAEAARRELVEAVAYYDAQAPGLGDDFVRAFLAAVASVEQYPQAWHRLSETPGAAAIAAFLTV